MSINGISRERGFSIELNSKEHVKRFTFLNESENRVLVEGFLGELQQITLVEELMLEINCSKGVLRIDVTEDELRQALSVNFGPVKRVS
jgi:hypothetical protein